jgi:hypothetical protein
MGWGEKRRRREVGKGWRRREGGVQRRERGTGKGERRKRAREMLRNMRRMNKETEVRDRARAVGGGQREEGTAEVGSVRGRKRMRWKNGRRSR